MNEQLYINSLVAIAMKEGGEFDVNLTQIENLKGMLVYKFETDVNGNTIVRFKFEKEIRIIN